MSITCTETRSHCECCGSTDREDLTTGDDGYTACCNERVTSQSDCDGKHVPDFSDWADREAERKLGQECQHGRFRDQACPDCRATERMLMRPVS